MTNRKSTSHCRSLIWGGKKDNMQIRPKAWRRASELLSASIILLTSFSADSLLSLSLAPLFNTMAYDEFLLREYEFYVFFVSLQTDVQRPSLVPFLVQHWFLKFIHSVVYCSTVHLQHQLAFYLKTLFRQGLRCCMLPVYCHIIYLRHGIYGAGIHLFGL